MLNKFAQVKEAEVRGVLAAFVDNGLINVQTPQQFDKLASVVSNNLPASYTVDDIANLTLPAMQKVAEDSNDNATQMALGELALMKVAGQVSDAEFDAMAEGILKEAASIDPYLPAVVSEKDQPTSTKAKNALHGLLNKAQQISGIADAQRAMEQNKNLKKMLENVSDHRIRDKIKADNRTYNEIRRARNNYAGKAALKGTGTLAALAGTGLAAKALYDKYKD